MEGVTSTFKEGLILFYTLVSGEKSVGTTDLFPLNKNIGKTDMTFFHSIKALARQRFFHWIKTLARQSWPFPWQDFIPAFLYPVIKMFPNISGWKKMRSQCDEMSDFIREVVGNHYHHRCCCCCCGCRPPASTWSGSSTPLSSSGYWPTQGRFQPR